MFDLEPEEARLLLNIAFLAVGRGRYRSAGEILDVLETFRPEREEPLLARAILMINQVALKEAIEYIDSIALPRFPDSTWLKTFRGLALMRLGKNEEALRMFSEVRNADNAVAAELAVALEKEIL